TAADDAGQATGPLRRGRARCAPGLHRRLGAPAGQRPVPPRRRPQGSVLTGERTRRGPHPVPPRRGTQPERLGSPRYRSEGTPVKKTVLAAAAAAVLLLSACSADETDQTPASPSADVQPAST